MREDIKIVIASPTESFCQRLSERINLEGNMQIVGIAHDGNAALDMCLHFTPDVLVTGLLLPNLDGIGLIRKIREHELFPKIIVVSGFFNSDTAATLSQLGVGRFLPMPCDLDEIIRTSLVPSDVFKVTRPLVHIG